MGVDYQLNNHKELSKRRDLIALFIVENVLQYWWLVCYNKKTEIALLM